MASNLIIVEALGNDPISIDDIGESARETNVTETKILEIEANSNENEESPPLGEKNSQSDLGPAFAGSEGRQNIDSERDGITESETTRSFSAKRKRRTSSGSPGPSSTVRKIKAMVEIKPGTFEEYAPYSFGQTETGEVCIFLAKCSKVIAHVGDEEIRTAGRACDPEGISRNRKKKTRYPPAKKSKKTDSRRKIRQRTIETEICEGKGYVKVDRNRRSQKSESSADESSGSENSSRSIEKDDDSDLRRTENKTEQSDDEESGSNDDDRSREGDEGEEKNERSKEEEEEDEDLAMREEGRGVIRENDPLRKNNRGQPGEEGCTVQ
jgi:hypothetical protein